MKKLLVFLFILLFSAPAFGVTIGDIDVSLLTGETMIETIKVLKPEYSAAFRYSQEIPVVIGVVIFNTYLRRFEYISIRYLKEGELHYYAWNPQLVAYVPTEIPRELKAFWIKQLKKYTDGI